MPLLSTNDDDYDDYDDDDIAVASYSSSSSSCPTCMDWIGESRKIKIKKSEVKMKK